MEPILHQITDHVLDREMQLLDAGRVVGRDDQRDVGELLEVAAGFPQQRDDERGHIRFRSRPPRRAGRA